VAGLGTIGLPLSAGQAKELTAVCEQAPYGKGTETLVDTSVRKVWRLTPDRFALTNPDWIGFLLEVLGKVQEGLGLEEQKLEAHLYDLLLYEPGSFFVPHQDGEKLDRMVATLVIVLPSTFEGGELIVRHEGQEETIGFGGDTRNAFRAHYAAFYADCEHEVRPLTAGYRLCLVYNLTLAKGKRKKGLTAPNLSGAIEPVANILREATAEEERKVVVTLEHQYTQDGLTWDALKGVDRSRARVLVEAARRADWKAYLALLTLHEVGSAEYAGDSGYGGGWYRDYDEDEDEDDEDEEEDAGEYEMGEVIESDLVAGHWRDCDDNPLPVGVVGVEEDELLDPDALREITPEEEFEGYTGNEGMTLDRWYRHGAILLWPAARHFEVLCAAGRQPALAALGELVNQWQKAGSKDVALRGQVRDFAVALLARWEAPQYYDPFEEEKPDACQLARALALLEEPDLIRTYLSNVLATDPSVDPGASIAATGKKLGWATFRPELEDVFAKTTRDALVRNVRLLESICTTSPGKKPGWGELCASLARTTVKALVDIDAQPRQLDDYYYDDDYEEPFGEAIAILTGLARALLASEQFDLLGQVVTHTLAAPKLYPLREAQVPALRQLKPWLGKHRKKSCPELTRWVVAVREQLEALTAQEPQPPADFRRPAEVKCKCAFCGELNRFLADPQAETHRFSTPEANRHHLEHNIREYRCDIDCRTEERGRPYTLICTKNQASFHLSVLVYHEDQKRLAYIRAVESGLPG
jgi:hypothetical protein